jgi:hypothetical protein
MDVGHGDPIRSSGTEYWILRFFQGSRQATFQRIRKDWFHQDLGSFLQEDIGFEKLFWVLDREK